MQHRPGLERYARSLGADPYLAEDLSTETFVRAWVYFDTRDRPTNLLRFLMRIERNLYFDYRRHDGRCRPVEVDDLDLRVEDFSGQVVAHDYVYAALRSLPETPRAVLTCTLLLDMSLAETATAVGLPSAGAAGVAAHRARKALLRHFIHERGQSNGT